MVTWAPSVWRSDRRSSPRLITAIHPPSTTALHLIAQWGNVHSRAGAALVNGSGGMPWYTSALVGCPASRERSQVALPANRPVCSGPLTARSAITIIMTPPPPFTIINDTLHLIMTLQTPSLTNPPEHLLFVKPSSSKEVWRA